MSEFIGDIIQRLLEQAEGLLQANPGSIYAYALQRSLSELYNGLFSDEQGIPAEKLQEAENAIGVSLKELDESAATAAQTEASELALSRFLESFSQLS